VWRSTYHRGGLVDTALRIEFGREKKQTELAIDGLGYDLALFSSMSMLVEVASSAKSA
jgi:hypothetical protein